MKHPSTSGADNQPYAGISEFELPQRTRELATRIVWELIRPCLQQLTQVKSKFQTAKESRDQNFAKTQSEVTSLLTALASKSSQAKTQLSMFGITPDTTPVASPAIFAIKDIETAKSEVASMDRQLQPILTEELQPFWPHTNAGRWAVVIVSVILFFAIPPRGVGLLIYPILMMIWRAIQTKGLKNSQKAFERNIQKLRDEINRLAIPPRQAYEAAEKAAQDQLEKELKKICSDFQNVADNLHTETAKLWRESVFAAAEWDSAVWQNWSPDASPEFAARIGLLAIDSDSLRTQFPNLDFAFKLPALIPFAENRCLLLNVTGNAKRAAANALLSVMIRVLANTPPGKARFTFFDPVGLGQNVADFMHLGDINKELISGKAWSEPQHIEHQLTLLTEHIETVIQTCLRKEFASIRDYNRERHEVALPFRFLVVNDFPVNFNEASARRLVSIVKNGPRCGVFTFILRDTAKPLPHGFNLDDLQEASTQIAFVGEKSRGENTQVGYFEWRETDLDLFELLLDEKSPPQTLTDTIVKKSGELAIPAMKIDVPFQKLLASASLEKDSWWRASTIENLKVPLGPAGARAIQELSLGGEQEAHALLVGRTGSGKTNLMHVIITALALKYSPQEVQLYLIDFKGGVGFKRYAECRLPHARVIAIESEREFGMSVLRGLDAELKQRSETFRAAGVDGLAAYRGKTNPDQANDHQMPRILLVVDEFQEFFSENDDLSQQAKMIFERLARQGRSFGIHFLLATQSLSGSAQLPSSIMGQIKVRIALPCNETDSRLILADDNKAARALSQPGEGIYNPLAGLVEGNNRFQVARFSDSDLPTYLNAISETNRDGYTPIIFEGNELAHVESCAPLKELLQAANWPQANKSVDVFLGEPIAIMPPVTVRLRRQSGSHLMILSRDEAEGVGMCLAAVLNIIAQQAPKTRRVFIADFATADSEWTEHTAEIARCFPGDTQVVRRQREIASMLASIAKEVQSRGDEATGQDNIYVILQGMHRIKALREDIEDEDGHNAVESLKTILRDGPEVGVHVVAWADTWGNITRGLDRRSIGEFGLRVATVMDSGDSMNFLDNLAASKISKPHRGVLYDEDRPGQLVPFRPYAMPPTEWLKQAGKRMRSRVEHNNAVLANPLV